MISLVIPVFNVAPYLPECLDSIANQSFRNIQIIAVDGASEDASGKILDLRRQAEPRLEVIHLTQNGPGHARNEGVKSARGDYVWFVDGDDTITPESLQKIAQRIETLRPDLLLVDSEIIKPNGRVEPGADHKLLGQQTSPSFTLAAEPQMAGLSMVSWNKIIRREFLLSSRIAFREMWPHEDVPFSCFALLQARTLSTLNYPCYRYRENRPGSVTATGKSDRHFRIFESWTIVLERVQKSVGSDDAFVTAQVYKALFERAIWHYSTILGTKGYIERSDRRPFFTKMHWHFAKYAPPDYQTPGGFRGVKFNLIARGAYIRYFALTPLNRLRMVISRAVETWREAGRPAAKAIPAPLAVAPRRDH